MSELSESDPHFPATRRKRVVAREVQGANLDAAALTPDELEPLNILPAQPAPNIIEALPAEPLKPHAIPVVDPTLLGRRHRRSGHHLVYRFTQFWTLAGALLAVASIVCTMVDEPAIGRIFAAAGIVAGFAASTLSRRTSLSERWRGWAIATIVFAVAALGLTWVHSTLVENERAQPSARSRR